METFPLNSLAEQFECDRGTMVRAMRGVAPDLVKPGNRPGWKVATAARALEAHRKKAWEEKRQKELEAQRRKEEASTTKTTTSRNGETMVLTGVAAQCAIAFDAYDKAQDKLQAIKTIEARRAFARAELGPIAREALALMRERDTKNGLHEQHVELRNQEIFRLMVRSIEGPCGWSTGPTKGELEAWCVLDPPRPGDDDYEGEGEAA
jgi:hypothetical protein